MIDGRHRAGADAVLSRYAQRPALTVMTAAHGLVEALSALRRLNHRRQLSVQDAGRAVAWLRELDVVLDPTAPRMRRIWELRTTMSAYDGAYAAGAEAYGVPLVTADERLRRACAAAGISAVGLGDLRDG